MFDPTTLVAVGANGVHTVQALPAEFDASKFTVVQRFAARARPYFLREVTGDAWAGEWPRAAFEGLVGVLHAPSNVHAKKTTSFDIVRLGVLFIRSSRHSG